MVIGCYLRVTAPGTMEPPYDAFVMRYANPEIPTVRLSEDRSVLEVRFARVSPNDGVEIRSLMDPALVSVHTTRPGLTELLEDQLRVVRAAGGGLRPTGSHPAVVSAAPLEGALLGMRITPVSTYQPGYGLSVNVLSILRTAKSS